MLKVASQRNVPPNCAETAGPNSHSPAPIEDPARRMPGPISVFQSRHEWRGAASSVETFQGGRWPAGTVAAPGSTIAAPPAKLFGGEDPAPTGGTDAPTEPSGLSAGSRGDTDIVRPGED